MPAVAKSVVASKTLSDSASTPPNRNQTRVDASADAAELAECLLKTHLPPPQIRNTISIAPTRL